MLLAFREDLLTASTCAESRIGNGGPRDNVWLALKLLDLARPLRMTALQKQWIS